jgi:O-antigen biosynthesis protein
MSELNFYFSKEDVHTLICGKKSICLFASYSEDSLLSKENVDYTNTLAKYFNTLIYLTNTRYITNGNLLSKNIQLKFLKNECLDFGMWFKVLKHMDISNVDRIALVNDSCKLINPNSLHNLLSTTNNYIDLWGITDSHEVNYHLQSYFLVIEKGGLSTLKSFVEESNIHLDTKLPKLPEFITKYEIGLTQYFLKHNRNVTAALKYTTMMQYFNSQPVNPFTWFWPYLIDKGTPIIKK